MPDARAPGLPSFHSRTSMGTHPCGKRAGRRRTFRIFQPAPHSHRGLRGAMGRATCRLLFPGEALDSTRRGFGMDRRTFRARHASADSRQPSPSRSGCRHTRGFRRRQPVDIRGSRQELSRVRKARDGRGSLGQHAASQFSNQTDRADMLRPPISCLSLRTRSADLMISRSRKTPLSIASLTQITTFCGR